jgi:hypothetical protein
MKKKKHKSFNKKSIFINKFVIFNLITIEIFQKFTLLAIFYSMEYIEISFYLYLKKKMVYDFKALKKQNLCLNVFKVLSIECR